MVNQQTLFNKSELPGFVEERKNQNIVIVSLDSDLIPSRNLRADPPALQIPDSRILWLDRLLGRCQVPVSFSGTVIFVHGIAQTEIKIPAEGNHVSSNSATCAEAFKLTAPQVDGKRVPVVPAASVTVRAKSELQFISADSGRISLF